MHLEGIFEEGLGVSILPLKPVQIRQIVQPACQIGVVALEQPLVHLEGIFEEGLGVGILPLSRVQTRQDAQAGGPIGVVALEQPLVHLDHLFEERFGLGQLPLSEVEVGQIVQCGSEVGVIALEQALAHCKRVSVEMFGVRQFALRLIQVRQVVQTGGEFRVPIGKLIFRVQAARDLQGHLERLLRLRVLAGLGRLDPCSAKFHTLRFEFLALLGGELLGRVVGAHRQGHEGAHEHTGHEYHQSVHGWTSLVVARAGETHHRRKRHLAHAGRVRSLARSRERERGPE